MQQASFNVVCREPRQYRPLRCGPEAKLQLAVQSRLDELFPQMAYPVWTGGSVPLGAGIPDIVRAAYEPEVAALKGADDSSLAVLAYLRTVGRARQDTICLKLRKPEKAIGLRLSALEAASIISEQNGLYVLTSRWRCVLPEVLCIEVKVADWRRALSQAARNRIFSNKSFIALPENVAVRIRDESMVRHLGIGLLAVSENDDVKIVRRARSAMPKAWRYYYSLASMAAEEARESNGPIQH